MANTLFLRLEGPMQSWGERARWSVRDTANEPTKSGIVGLLGCALGWAQDEDLRGLSQSIRLGIRCDRPGVIIKDYHTIVGGVMSAEGKIKINASTHLPETVVSWRKYLCDASFLAAVQSDPEWISLLAHAVQNPVWPVFLGRKSCPPSQPVYVSTADFSSLEEALKHGLIGEQKTRAVIECKPGEGTLRRDEISSNRLRIFLPRYTHDIWLQGSSSPQEVL